MEQETNTPLDYTANDQYIDPEKVPSRPTAFRWGLYGAMAAIAIGLIFYLTGLADFSENGGGRLNQVLSWVIWIATIFMAIRAHKEEDLGGYISFKRAFTTGTLAGLVFALITAVWTYLFFTLIAPDALQMVTEAAYTRMEEQGLSDDQIEASEGMLNMMTSPPVMSLMIFVSCIIVSLIISLILSAIMKKDVPHSV